MQLLEHFASLTLHPKNAQELKGLILQLAIQGKLTANWRKENSNLEPASEILKIINEEKKQLLKEKKIRNEKPLTPINKEDIPFELPNNWIWCRMLDFCYLITDGAHHTPKYVDDGIPFLSVKNLSKGFLDFSDTKFIERETHNELIKRCNPEYNDVLLTKIGTTGIAKVIDTKQEFSIFVSVALLKIAKKNLFPYYIENCINSPFIKKQSLDGTEGVGNKNLVLRKIKDFLIPLPPLEEQKEIVRVVEILFKEVEQLEQLTVERIALKNDYVSSALKQLTTQNSQKEWQSLQPHFKDFFTEKSTIKKLRETILQLAVQGKLTADWRTKNKDFEPASELLKRIQEEKAQLIKDKKIKKESPLPAITKEEIPYELPEGWVWCRLNDLGIIGSSSRVHQKDWQSEGIPFYRAREIVKLSRFGYVDNDLFITEELFNKFKENGSVPELNDIMITGVGTIGIPYIVNKEDRFYFKDASVLIFKNIFNLYSEYLDLFFSCQYWKNEIHKDSMGTTVHTLTISRAKLVPTILPPFEEQKAIVKKVTALMGLCDALEQEVEKSKGYSEQLMQSVLREVFEGEKV